MTMTFGDKEEYKKKMQEMQDKFGGKDGGKMDFYDVQQDTDSDKTIKQSDKDKINDKDEK